MRKHRDTERTAAMIAMYLQGITQQKIADKYGLTRERVRQLIRQGGCETKAGARVKATAKVERRNAAREMRIRTRWGCDLETWRRGVSDGSLTRYRYHERNSSLRGIPFTLTYLEWLTVWNTSGKLHLCGRGKGHFCMSRINDSGGYEVGNVHIQSCVENSREAVKKWVGKTKANPGVFNLYPGTNRPWLAKVGKARLGFFATEAEAVAARDIYKAANPSTGRSGLGNGRGWTLLRTAKTRPYQMQGPGGARSYHATQEEAEAAYRAAVDAYRMAA